jgi:hypothetical protein
MAVLFPVMARSGISVSPAQQVGNQVAGTIALRLHYGASVST